MITDEQVAAGLDAKAVISRNHFYLYSTEMCKCGDEYTDAHVMRLILEYVEKNGGE